MPEETRINPPDTPPATNNPSQEGTGVKPAEVTNTSNAPVRSNDNPPGSLQAAESELSSSAVGASGVHPSVNPGSDTVPGTGTPMTKPRELPEGVLYKVTFSSIQGRWTQNTIVSEDEILQELGQEGLDRLLGIGAIREVDDADLEHFNLLRDKEVAREAMSVEQGRTPQEVEADIRAMSETGDQHDVALRNVGSVI
jgi:hypothetical protein